MALIKGPLGNYGIAQSLVQTPGWKPLEAEGPLEQALRRGGGGGGFSMGFGGGEYRGRIGADTSNLPPSQRGLYENSAPSLEAIQGAYDANLARGMTHQEIMKLFNEQADRDAKFWAEGFAKDPNFSQTLYDKSQKILGSNQAAKQRAFERATVKNKYTGQTVNDQLRASRGAFTTPTLGPTAGSWSAPTVKSAASSIWGPGSSYI